MKNKYFFFSLMSFLFLGSMLVLNDALALAGAPKYFRGPYQVASITCGDAYTFEVEGYYGTNVWLKQVKDGTPIFNGPFFVPMSSYTSVCNSEEGSYETSVYEVKNCAGVNCPGVLLGSTGFTIYPKPTPTPTPISTPESTPAPVVSRDLSIQAYWDIPSNNSAYDSKQDYDNNGVMNFTDSKLLATYAPNCPAGKFCDINGSGSFNTGDSVKYALNLQNTLTINKGNTTSGVIYMTSGSGGTVSIGGYGPAVSVGQTSVTIPAGGQVSIAFNGSSQNAAGSYTESFSGQIQDGGQFNSNTLSLNVVAVNVVYPTVNMSCSLAVNKNQINAGESATWTMSGDWTGYKIYWFGTKDGVPDVTDSDSGFTTNKTWITDPYPANSQGSYTRYFKVHQFSTSLNSNLACTSNTVAFSVLAPTTTAPKITVLTPNGGEVWQPGEVHRITWASVGVSGVKIYISDSSISGSGSVNYITPDNIGVSATQGYYDWTIPPLNQLPSLSGNGGTNYRIRIDDINSPNQPFANSDSSDGVFTIRAVTVSTIPKVDLMVGPANSPSFVHSNGPITVNSGSGATFSWNLTDSAWSLPCTLTDALGLSANKTGTVTVNNISASKTYTMTCYLAGIPYSDSVTVNVGVPEITTPVSVVKVTSPNGGEKWEKGKPYTVNWQYNGTEKVWVAVACENYGYGPYYNITTSPAGGSYTFTISPEAPNQTQCKAQVGAMSLVNINNARRGIDFDDSDTNFSVIPASSTNISSSNIPKVDLKVGPENSPPFVHSDGPISVDSGKSATFSWNLSDSLWSLPCKVTDATLPTTKAGDFTLSNLTQSKTYTLTCYLAGIPYSDSVTVNVNSVTTKPSFTFSHKDSTLKVGESWTYTLQNGKVGDRLYVNAILSNGPGLSVSKGQMEVCTVESGTSCSLTRTTPVSDVGIWYEDVYINNEFQEKVKFTVVANPSVKVVSPNVIISPLNTEPVDQSRLYDLNEIQDGDIIRGQGDIAVWIIKTVGEKRFKRWLFGPQIFQAYGHLGFNKVKNVSKETLNRFDTAVLIRKANDEKVYELTDFVPGKSATRRWIPTAETFLQRGFDFDSVYVVNEREYNFYTEGSPLPISQNTKVKSSPLTANLSEAMARFFGR